MSYKDPTIFLNDDENDPAKVLYSDFAELEKEYKSLLNECLSCLNEMPNRYIKERFMTHDLAAKIETLLRS